MFTDDELNLALALMAAAALLRGTSRSTEPLDAAGLPDHGAAHAQSDLAVIVSHHFYDGVVRQQPSVVEPAGFRQVVIRDRRDKEARLRGWIWTPEGRSAPDAANSPVAMPGVVVGVAAQWDGSGGGVHRLPAVGRYGADPG